MKSIAISILVLVLSFQTAEAQLFKKLKNRTEQKIKQRAEQKIVEGVSEELARRAMKPIDNAFDDMFRQSYKDQYGKDYDDSDYDDDPEKKQAMMNQVLSQMYGDVELPEKYEFAYVVEIDVTNFGEKKPERMKMLLDPINGAFGMVQKQDGKLNTMVFDSQRDQVVMLNDDDMTAMAVSNVSKMTSVYGRQSTDRPDGKLISFNKLDKSKKILKYMCEGYEMETEEYSSVFFVTDRLPFNWTDSFGGIAKNLSPNFYKEHPEYKIEGMLMEGTTKKKKTSEESNWIVKKISDKTYTINCSDYKLQNMMAQR